MRLNSNSDDELKDQSDDGNVQVLLHFADFKQTRNIACRLCVVPHFGGKNVSVYELYINRFCTL